MWVPAWDRSENQQGQPGPDSSWHRMDTQRRGRRLNPQMIQGDIQNWNWSSIIIAWILELYTLWLADIQTSDLCLWQKEDGFRIEYRAALQHPLEEGNACCGCLIKDGASAGCPGRLQELIRLDCGVIGDSLPRNEEHTPTLRSTNITDITTTIHSPHHSTQRVASTVILLGKWILELEINQYSVGLF